MQGQIEGQPESEDGPFYNVGKGLCRGEEWQSGNWPQDGGMQNVEGCGGKCEKTPGCHAFDVSGYEPRSKKFKCWLHGLQDPEPASALDGNCYKLTGTGSDETLAGPGLIKIGKLNEYSFILHHKKFLNNTTENIHSFNESCIEIHSLALDNINNNEVCQETLFVT